MNTEVLIVGGGLSGLHSAYLLHQRGVPFLLLEARERFGGRILSVHGTGDDAESYDAQRPGFDLGPAWFWPGQANMLELVRELALESQMFQQFSKGAAIFEDARGRQQRGIQGMSMAGSYRLHGGIRQLAAALEGQLPVAQLNLGARVTQVRLVENRIQANAVVNDEPQLFTAEQLIFALPPRLAADSIDFVPALAKARLAELSAIPTWMAGHAKVLTFYDKPFWRDDGLSGDAMSQLGPLHEIHDASAHEGPPYALFGFVGVPAAQRRGQEAALRKAVTEQLVRLFGSAAATPELRLPKDWAADRLTATPADQAMMTHHAAHDLVRFAESSWGDRLHWSGAETASCHTRNNGYLEGAVEASHRTVQAILNARDGDVLP